MKKIIIITLLIIGIVVIAIFAGKSKSPEPQLDLDNARDTQTNSETVASDIPVFETGSSFADETNVTGNKKIINMDSQITGFTPNIVDAIAGEPIVIHLTSSGEHTFTIDELNVDVKTPNGETAFSFTPEKAGIFEFYCAIPGHREQGQWGSIRMG